MLQKIKNIFFILSFFIFIFFTSIHYFSNEYTEKINKNRIFYSTMLENNLSNLTLLKNDTNNIIEFRDDIDVYKKNKKKYSFWGLLDK